MNVVGIDEALIQHLPLPLAQLYHSVQRPHKSTPLERYLSAFQLWEASLKLLSSVAIAQYAHLQLRDGKLEERLTNLARPALGHWWEFARLLVPVLAANGDPDFQKVEGALLRTTLDDCPAAAALNVALQEEKEKRPLEPRRTVRLQELFDRLVWLRNRETGHGAPGQRPNSFYTRMSEKMLPGVVEMLRKLNVLAGRRMIYIAEVSRQADGRFTIKRYELTGEMGRGLDPLYWSGSDASRLPYTGHIYLEDATRAAESSVLPVVSLHPLLVYDDDEQEVLFLNRRADHRRIEFLGYNSGRTVERQEMLHEQQKLLARLLGTNVDDDRFAEWADRAEKESLQEEKQAVQDDDQAMPEKGARPPRRLADFELLSILGEGGMGVVYRARQISLGRQVALKCLHRGSNENRFAKEIRALGRAKHPHLVEIYTSGSESEQWFYAMELIEGTTLEAICSSLGDHLSTAAELDEKTWDESVKSACGKSRQAEKSLAASPIQAMPARHAEPPGQENLPTAPGIAQSSASPVQPLPALAKEKRSLAPLTCQNYFRHVATLLAQIAQAAHALHEQGIIHRDIKPGNIMVTPEGNHAVLMDLGLAKMAQVSLEDRTKTRQFVGTLRYASPEQVHSAKSIDRRTDIFSLGATMWELLTFRPIHGADEDLAEWEIERRILFEDAEPVRVHNSKVPRDLEAVVARCLQRNPDARYTTAQELAEDLQRFLAGEPVRTRRIARFERSFKWARKRLKNAAFYGLILAVIPLGFLAGVLIRPEQPDKKNDAPPPIELPQSSGEFLRVAIKSLPPDVVLVARPNPELSARVDSIIWTHAFDLASRHFGESQISASTRRFGIEVFRDANTEFGIYASEVGSLAVGKGFKQIDRAISNSKGPKSFTGLDLPARNWGEQTFTKSTTVNSMEAFRDPNVGNDLWVTEKGFIAVASGPDAPFPNQPRNPRWVGSYDLRCRVGGVKEWADARKFGVEVYMHDDTGNLVYIVGETGSIAIIRGIAAKTKQTPEKGHAPVWLHGLDLMCRKHDEPKFSNSTRKLGIEIYRDVDRDNLLHISDAGTIAVVSAPKNTKAPTPNPTNPIWSRGFNIRSRKSSEKQFTLETPTYGCEVFTDPNTGTILYVAETGSISAVAGRD